MPSLLVRYFIETVGLFAELGEQDMSAVDAYFDASKASLRIGDGRFIYGRCVYTVSCTVYLG